MMNLKKTLAVVLAFAMIFSMGVSTFAAYSDVEEGTTVGEAVGILSNLGIFTGFEDGTFKPEDTVTRAQMATIICRTLGYEDQAKSSGGSTAFTDVAADHWAAGYINVAQSLGIVNGMGDGTFAPEAEVKYEEAVKMIVCALNYELVAANKGGWPTGYLSVASSEGITKSANGKVGDPAKRGTIAVLVYNSLEVRLFDQDSWTTNGEDSYAKSDDTILSRYLEVEKWEGTVTSDPYTYIADNGYDPDATPEIVIDGFESYYENGKLVKDYDDAPVTADASLVDVEGLFGKKVVAYIGSEEDDETGNVMVYSITEKNNANTTVSINGTQLVDDEDKEYEIGEQISYRKTGSSKVYDLDLDKDTDYYVNYKKADLDKDAEGNYVKVTTKALYELLYEDDEYCGGTIEFISNDNDEAIEYVMIKAYQDESIIEEVVEEDGIYSFTLYNANGQLDEIDTDDEDVYGEIYKDGVKVDVTALAANDTVSTLLIGGDVDAKMLFVSSETVEGSVDSYDDETVTINGVDYEISKFYGKEPKALKDEEGIFFLNVDGQIAHNETDTAAAGNYGLVLAVDYESGITDGYVMQVAMADGSVVEYDLASKAKFYDYATVNKETVYTTVGADDEATAKAVAEIISGSSSFNSGAAKLQVGKAADSVFKFTFKNDEITKIKALQGDSIDTYLKANTKKYDAEAMSYGSAEFDEKTVVFAIEPVYGEKSETVIEDDDVAVGAVSEFFADEDDNVIFVGLDDEDGICQVVVGFDLKASVPEDSDAVIVTAKKTVTYDDDDAVQISGIQAGEEVSFIIYDEDADYTNADPEDLDKGDVILVAAANGEGVVSDFKLLYDASEKEVSDEALEGDASDDIYNAVGNLNKALTKESNSKFYIDANVKNDANAWAYAEDGITIKASANYTLVDYSESTKNPEIAKKSSNAVFSTSSKYETVVFVRVYDDVLTEVVAYRYLAK